MTAEVKRVYLDASNLLYMFMFMTRGGGGAYCTAGSDSVVEEHRGIGLTLGSYPHVEATPQGLNPLAGGGGSGKPGNGLKSHTKTASRPTNRNALGVFVIVATQTASYRMLYVLIKLKLKCNLF